MGSFSNFYMSGDLGDIISSLPFVRQKGGGNIIISNHPKMEETKCRPMKGKSFDVIKPLLACQEYIASVLYIEGYKDASYDFMNWREVYSRTRSLAHSQAYYFGMNEGLDVSPWLKVKDDPRSLGRVVVTRSERYRSNAFPWPEIANKYGPKLMFVGFPEEHADFEKKVRMKVDYVRTNDLLELAQLISGSSLYIGNQTCATWIAMGLGHPLIQECYTRYADSIIPRPNAQFVIVGKPKLPNV